MDFDDKSCPCPELVELTRQVFMEISEEDRKRIEAVCDRVVFVRGMDAEAEFIPTQIRVFLSRTREFTRAGRRGIIAHEFGHTYVYSAYGYTKADHKAEKLADTQARLWGFGPDLKARNKEAARLRDTNTQEPLCGSSSPW